MINEELYERILRERGIAPSQHKAIVQTGDKGPFGLSYAQHSIWFLQQLNPESSAYNNCSAVRIVGRLDEPCMRRAFAEIVRRHEILRVNYRMEQGEPTAFLRDREVDFTLIPWEQSGKRVDDPAVLEFINELAGKVFDLESDPLIGFTLLRFSEEEYILVIRMHHIISDGWSKGVLLQEFTRIYDAWVQRKSYDEAPLRLQYSDYVKWQVGRTHDPRLAGDVKFWQDKLHGAPPLLELPTDKKRPSVISGRGSLTEFRFEADLYGQIESFCRQERISTFNFLLAIFKTLLFRYSGSEDLLVGTPVAGRNQSELEPLIGMFVNTVVIRTRAQGELTFREFVQEVKEETVQAFNHQEAPFGLLVEKLNPERERSYHPIFQTMFQFDNLPMPEMAAYGIRLLPMPLDIGIAQCDLSVSCWADQGELHGTFEYSSDLFTLGTVKRMISHFRQLTMSVLAQPQDSLGQLPILGEDETRMILTEWNQTDQRLPEVSFCWMIEQRAADTPDQCAVMQKEGPLSYREMNGQANRLAQELAIKGVSSETPVAVCLPSSSRFVIAVLAVFKAGGAVTPIDPAAPRERIERILNELGPVCAISDVRHEGLLSLPADSVILIDEDAGTVAVDDERDPDPKATPRQLACIIFTSGTTGVPKGVLLEHRSVNNLVYSFIASYRVQATDRLLPITSVSSASFIGEVLPILAAGGTLVLPDTETMLHSARLKAYMEEQRVTILSTVPSVVSHFNSDGGGLPVDLRLILSGGETLLPSQTDKLGNIAIANGYGLTESGICNTYVLMESNSDQSSAFTVSLGRPLANQRVYVLDASLRPVPIGVKGEICLSGNGLARGYLNNLELTQDKFIPHPFLPGEELLRTGDVGYWLPDGELCFVGRNDRQVQIRGYRIELAEIEKHLNAYRDVQEAVVHPQHDYEGNLKLVAYYTVRHQGSIIGQQLAHWLDPLIPSYMKPAAYVQLDRIPLNVNGKLDASALPQPTEIWNRAEMSYEKPATAEEKVIAQVWEDILQVRQFGVDDNFFDLGGHSLLLAKVHERLKDQFETNLTIVDLFKYPTVRSLARYLRHDTHEVSVVEINEKADKQKKAFLRYRKASPSVAVPSIESEGGLNGHESLGIQL